MKKFLSFVSKSVLVLCLTLQFGYAMEVENNRGIKRKASESVEQLGFNRKTPLTERMEQQRAPLTERDQKRLKRTAPAREKSEQEGLTRQVFPTELLIPSDMLKSIFLCTLKRNWKSFPTILSVCKYWYNTLKSLPMDFSPWDHQVTNEVLKKWPNLGVLVLDNGRTTDAGLQHVPNLICLTLIGNSQITDQGLKKLPELRTLNLRGYNQKITNEGLQTLTNLRCLRLWINSTISDHGILNLSNLTSLHLSYDRFITNEGLKNLHNLTHLDLTANKRITGEVFTNLHNLTHLDLSGNGRITDGTVKDLTRLTSLILRSVQSEGAPKVTDNALKTLSSLTHLDLSANPIITDDGVEGLTQLRYLMPSPSNTWWGLKPLKNLQNKDELKKIYGPKFVADCRYRSMNAYNKAWQAQSLLDPVNYFSKATQYLSFVLKDFRDLTDIKDRESYNLCRTQYLSSKEKLEKKLQEIFRKFSETERNTEVLQQIRMNLKQMDEEMLSCPKDLGF